MEYKCTGCGNIFDNILGTCPACGTPVESQYAEQQAQQPNVGQQDYQAQQPNVGQQSYQAQQPNVGQQDYQAQQPNVGQQDYQAQQPNAGQQGYQAQQPNVGQQDYQAQQQNYQQPPYQGQPNYQQPPYQASYGYKDPNAKSKIAAGILGILLGWLGVHNFYLGYTGKAVGQLLITVCSCGVLSGISAIWGLIEGILILTGSINTDASGRQLSD